jgi:hypothetical protein
VFKAGLFYCLNILAWNNEIGLPFFFFFFFFFFFLFFFFFKKREKEKKGGKKKEKFGSILLVSRTEVMINRDSWGG